MAMTKKEFIDGIKSRLACENIIIDKKTCEACVNVALLIARTEVLEQGEFSYPNFGKLKKVTRAARTAKNPRTGEPVDVPEKDAVTFKAAPSFLDV